jgi:hypothetical protein
MLLDLLARYLGDVEAAVRGIEDAYVERYEEEIVAVDRVNLRIRVRLPRGYLLELNEAIIVELGHIRHLGYRYHLQDGQTILSFDMITPLIFLSLGVFPITNTSQIK